MKLRVTCSFDYQLPSAFEREELYGTVNLLECVRIDLDNDPGAFFMDYAENITIDRLDVTEEDR